jgi:hypothetical protein
LQYCPENEEMDYIDEDYFKVCFPQSITYGVMVSFITIPQESHFSLLKTLILQEHLQQQAPEMGP